MPDHAPTALVLLAEGAEEMETVITVDVLRRAGVTVILAGLDGPGPVRCSRGVVLVPDAALADVPGPVDAVVLPGGAEGARRLAASPVVGRWLAAQADRGALIGAICAAPTALAAHGVHAGSAMTCHPAVRAGVGQHGRLVPGRVVEDGVLVTSQGPGTTFDFALALAARLAGPDVAAGLREPMRLDA